MRKALLIAMLLLTVRCFTWAQQTVQVPLSITVHHRITLNWTASTSSGTGCCTYRIYRGTITGGPYSQIASGLNMTTWDDTTPTNGATYYYVATAVNTAGAESARSNEASATVN
jgi:fibronectin type 3 domain-containing protein